MINWKIKWIFDYFISFWCWLYRASNIPDNPMYTCASLHSFMTFLHILSVQQRVRGTLQSPSRWLGISRCAATRSSRLRLTGLTDIFILMRQRDGETNREREKKGDVPVNRDAPRWLVDPSWNFAKIGKSCECQKFFVCLGKISG